MATMSKVGKTATTVRKADGVLSVVYHSTEVVKANDDGTITLNTGGWRTVTTKARMNQAANQFGLGFQVSQEDFEWFVRVPKNGDWRDCVKIPFADYSITFSTSV